MAKGTVKAAACPVFAGGGDRERTETETERGEGGIIEEVGPVCSGGEGRDGGDGEVLGMEGMRKGRDGGGDCGGGKVKGRDDGEVEEMGAGEVEEMGRRAVGKAARRRRREATGGKEGHGGKAQRPDTRYTGRQLARAGPNISLSTYDWTPHVISLRCPSPTQTQTKLGFARKPGPFPTYKALFHHQTLSRSTIEIAPPPNPSSSPSMSSSSNLSMSMVRRIESPLIGPFSFSRSFVPCAPHHGCQPSWLVVGRLRLSRFDKNRQNTFPILQACSRALNHSQTEASSLGLASLQQPTTMTYTHQLIHNYPMLDQRRPHFL
nr:unnamed protein product [Digitaria exilis]